MPVSTLVTVIEPFRMAAPLVSVTVPVIVPSGDCAERDRIEKNKL
jgi:hypothetical protein